MQVIQSHAIVGHAVDQGQAKVSLSITDSYHVNTIILSNSVNITNVFSTFFHLIIHVHTLMEGFVFSS